jgi:hypothetical protein
MDLDEIGEVQKVFDQSFGRHPLGLKPMIAIIEETKGLSVSVNFVVTNEKHVSALKVEPNIARYNLMKALIGCYKPENFELNELQLVRIPASLLPSAKWIFGNEFNGEVVSIPRWQAKFVQELDSDLDSDPETKTVDEVRSSFKNVESVVNVCGNVAASQSMIAQTSDAHANTDNEPRPTPVELPIPGVEQPGK